MVFLCVLKSCGVGQKVFRCLRWNCCSVPQHVWKHILCSRSCSCEIIRSVINCKVELKARIGKSTTDEKCITIQKKSSQGCELRLKTFLELKAKKSSKNLGFYFSFLINVAKWRLTKKCFITTASVPCNRHVNLPQAGRRQPSLCISCVIFVLFFWYSIASGKVVTVLFAFYITAFQIIRK